MRFWNQKLSLRKFTFYELAQIFCSVAIFTLPLRIRSLVYSSSSYELGFFNEYASFFVYLSEIFCLLAFFFLGVAYLRRQSVPLNFTPLKQYLNPFLALLGLSVLVIPFAHDPFLALIFFWRTFEFTLVAVLLGAGLLNRFWMIKVLTATFFLQAILGVGQYLASGSLGLAFLGESWAEALTFNVAKVVLPNASVAVRGLGTLAHANILGGVLALVLLLLVSYSSSPLPDAEKQRDGSAEFRPYKSLIAYFAAVILEVGLFFTFSRAAYLAFFTGLAVLVIFEFRRRAVSSFLAVLIFAVLMTAFGSPFFVRLGEEFYDQHSGLRTEAVVDFGRVVQFKRSAEIMQNRPLGTGRGSYIFALAQQDEHLQNYQLQPVHNFFALKAAEESAIVALAWLALFGALAFQALRQRKFTALAVLIGAFVLAQFDHYLADSFAGEFSLFLVFGFVLAELTAESRYFKKMSLRA